MTTRNRRAFSIPMVVLFCSFLIIGLFAFITTRMTMKSQIKLTFQRLKASYLAQAGIQHALLKLRILPNEGYDAASIARRACPFMPPGQGAAGSGGGDDSLLRLFYSDVKSAVYSITFSDPDFSGWEYETIELRPIMANTITDATTNADTRTHAVVIVVEGRAKVKIKGVVRDAVDKVERTVKIDRRRS